MKITIAIGLPLALAGLYVTLKKTKTFSEIDSACGKQVGKQNLDHLLDPDLPSQLSACVQRQPAYDVNAPW